MIALALAGKEPGQTAMAVDVLVCVLLEQRCDARMLGADIGWVLQSQLGTGARYAKSLASAARAHPNMPAAVVNLLCAIFDVAADALPKDVGPLLALLLELTVSHKLALPVGARGGITRFSLTGKALAAQRDLLERHAL